MGYAKAFEAERQRRESLQEAYDEAKRIHDNFEELGEEEAWNFVEALVNEFGGIPDTCCCCIGRSAQGAHELAVTERLWREAVIATVKNCPKA